jgi:hypothetical protein
MMRFTLQDLRLRLQRFIEGSDDFSVVRDWVFEFDWGERSLTVDTPLDEVFSVLLPYLQYEEAKEDSKRDVRMRRVYGLLPTT